MGLKKLEVPTSSITEVKKSPMDVFAQAREADTGVYIFNREKVAGVMLTQDQYEDLIEELHLLRETKKTTPVKKTVVPAEVQAAPPVPELEPLSEELASLAASLRQTIVSGTEVSARYLDEQMVIAGFITKKTGFGGVTDMLRELSEHQKMTYQLRRREHNQLVFAEISAKLVEHHQHTDQLLIEGIHLIKR